MDPATLSYVNALYPVPNLSPQTITNALAPNVDDDEFDTLLQSLIRDSDGNEIHIPIEGNQDGPFWNNGKDTPITYAIKLSHHWHSSNLHDRIAQLVSVLYLYCGISVQRDGYENPLEICVDCGNLPAATALLRDTDACFGTWFPCERVLRAMVHRRQTKMLQLFAEYKSRTFPKANEYLNMFEGHEKKYILLFTAVFINDPELVRLLIYEFGAKPNIKDNKGKMAIDLIINTEPNVGFRGQLDVERDKRRKIIRLLDPEGFYCAFYMSQHPRLGSDSMLQSLPIEMMARIRELSMQD